MAIGEDDDVAAYVSMLESTWAANDRLGEGDVDDWAPNAADKDEYE